MKTQNYNISHFLVISSTITYSQKFKERHVRKLENLGVPFKTEYSASEQATEDLHQVLHYDFKRRAKNKVGASLLKVGLDGLVGGVLLMRGANYDQHGFRSIAASGCFFVGAAEVGTSIPLFVGARKTRKKRNQLKILYQSDSANNTFLLQSELLKTHE